MHITLYPVRMDETLTLSISGDSLTLNGEDLDLSTIPEGATLPRSAVEGCPWLAGDISRIDGELHLALVMPHGARAPEETRFPAPLTVTTDGPVTLPPYDEPESEDEDPADADA